MVTPSCPQLPGSLTGNRNISRTKTGENPRIRPGGSTQAGGEQGKDGKSGPGGLAEGIVGPVAVKPGHAPFDALAEAGKTAVLDDRVVHLVQLAVAQHDVAAAIAARDIVGLPWPERGFMDLAIGFDLQRRIPELAFLLLELGCDRAQGFFA